MSTPTASAVPLQGFYVSFRGESPAPINNIYALSPSGELASATVLDTSRTYQELRGMAFGPDGCLYVCEAYKKDSRILQFTPPTAGYTWNFSQEYATPVASPGLLHPYGLAFGPDRNLYVSSQDTNVVTGFFGPDSPSAGTAMPDSPSLPTPTPPQQYYAGTIVPAHSADSNAPPPPFPPVSVKKGGLTFSSAGGSNHSVRGVAFDNKGNLYAADEARNRVVVYGPGSQNFKFLGAITHSNNRSLQDPVALSFDGDSLLYIGSPGNQRIFTYEVSKVKSGHFKAHVFVHDPKRLDKVSGIAAASGHVYTCSRKTNSVYRWSTSGKSHKKFPACFTDAPEQILPVYNGFFTGPGA